MMEKGDKTPRKKDLEDKNSSNSHPKVNKIPENINVTDTKSPPEKSEEKVGSSSSDGSQTKVTNETALHNGVSKTNTLNKKKRDSASSESRPDTPTSHSSLDLDLEEKLLRIDPDLAQDDPEDFCEEKLLLESDDEFTLKDKENEEIKTSKEKSLFKEGEKSASDKTDEGSTDRQDKEIEKILKNLNDSLENKHGKDNTDSTTFRKITTNNKNLKLSSKNLSENSNSKSSGDEIVAKSKTSKNNNSGKRKSLDTNDSNSIVLNKRKLSNSSNSLSNSKNIVKRKLSDVSTLEGNSSLAKTKLIDSNDSDSSNNSNKSTKSNSKLNISNSKEAELSREASSSSSKLKPKGQSEKNSSKSAITFSEALKSLEMDNYNLLQDKPTPLVPTMEITNSDTITPPSSSSLTLLQPASRKSSNSSSISSDNITEEKTLEEEEEDGTTSSQEESKKSEKSLPTPLKENEESNGLKNGSGSEDLVAIKEKDFQRKTVEEMQEDLFTNSKLRRIKRKDLESLIIELFVDKVLYEHQLGQHKDLSKRLEATLESTRKKAAQFHKEIEDLKKVTHRLQAEHLARKSHLVAPVKVKRSVGIQATPTIIGKGMMNVSSSPSIRVLTPSIASTVPVINNNNNITSNNGSTNNSNKSLNQVSNIIDIRTEPKSINSSSSSSSSPSLSYPSAQALAKPPKPRIKSKVAPSYLNDSNKGTQSTVINSTKTVNLTGQQTNAGTPVMVPFVVQPQNAGVGSQFIPVTAARLVRTPLTPVNSSATQFSQASLTSSVTGAAIAAAATNTSGSSFIDLTDDDEAAKNQRASLQAGGLVAIQRTTAAGVNINQNSSGQFVTLNPPSSVGQLLLVPSSNGQPPTALVVGSVANTNTTGMVRTSISQNSNVKISSPVGIVQSTRAIVGTQMTGGIVLSWNMAKTDEHERIASYQIYAYQEGTAAPTPTLWKKVGSVKALELPMACTLTQFMPGHVYHFAVRAVDIRSRLGPYSDPKSIRLGS
ncbi:Activating transcription factor 7-interacting protein 1 [Armadillidium nasatum]|uniref:Activating transcription factor 7-interacting protein 1 n=1 Tax=Armadillidium nasatum TaxID=96803 RepID=A0A5N5TIZ4_9CRUS|nr:Activating transcription factor 7-interacting protein 1 [Armadillidium nasatum]